MGFSRSLLFRRAFFCNDIRLWTAFHTRNLWWRDFYLLCTVFSEGEGEANLNWRFKVGASMKSSSDNVDGAEGGFLFTRQASAFLRKRWTGAGCGSVCCWLCGLSSWCAELLDQVRLEMSTEKTSWLDSMVSLFGLVGGRSTDLMVKHWINLLKKNYF